MIDISLDERGHAAQQLGLLVLEKIELQHEIFVLRARVKYLEQFEPVKETPVIEKPA